jgi:hypothetical protein
MIISRKAISRRTVLRGLGASLSLPLLDSMVPAMTALAQTKAAPLHRFGVVYVPNGMVMEQYLPATEGRGFEFTPTLKGIEPFREQTLVLSGLNCIPSPGRPGGAHAKASTRYLTNISPPTSETWLDAGISLDQILANEFGKETQLASLELAIENSDTAGACDVGFACAYTNTISWKSSNTPLPMQHNPRAVFERLFGDSGSTDTHARLARMKRQRSVLDSVTEEANSLGGSLGPSDRLKLTEYLDAVRDVERRIQKAESQSDRELPVMDRPAGAPASYEDHVKLMFDLEVLAYQSDLTRVTTLMLGREFSGMTYPQINVPDAHHPVTHHAGEVEKIAKVALINAYHVRLFGYLLEKMKATPDGDGTLLDHVTMIYGAGLSDCNAHAVTNVPVVLAGGGAGRTKGGRHVHFKDLPLANLHLTLLDRFGIHMDKFGDSNGRIEDRILAGV